MMNFLELKKQYKDGKLGKPEFIRMALELHQQIFHYVDVVRSTDINEIRITDDGVSFLIGNHDINLYCPSNESRVAPIEVMNFDQYEPEETQVIDLLISEATTILDVGANIGWYTLYFAKQYPGAKIFSFEPIPISYTYLQRNIALNGIGDRVTAFNYGLSDTNGVTEFFISPASGTNASLKNVSASPNAVSITGFTLTLDQWVQNYGITPDFIKCDVEGAEFLVFKGARKTLEQYHPIVFSELLRKWSMPFGYHPNEMISFFERFGYWCFGVGVSGVRRMAMVSEETIETNYIFLHSKVHTHLIERLEYQP